MRPAVYGRVLLTALLAAAAAPVLARSCEPVIGQGWPPAVGNYGEAAVQLLGGAVEDGVSMLTLPVRGQESQVLLRRDADSGQWRVLAGVADERIYNWNSGRSRGGVNLVVDQQPDFVQAPVPEALAQRLVQAWTQALSMPEVAGQAPVTEAEVVSFTVGGRRYSGKRSSCGPLEALQDQAVLLVELAHSKDKKYEKRYADIERALDRMHNRFYGQDAD